MRAEALSMTGLLSALIAIGSACASQLTDPGPGKRVEARVAQQIYYSGETVVVTVKNVSSLTLTYPGGFCRTDLQRFQSGDWTTVSVPPDGCALYLGILEPGATAVLHYPLSNTIGTGLYRLMMPMPVPRNATSPEPKLSTPSFNVNPVTFSQ